jgi:hypothetical protein
MTGVVMGAEAAGSMRLIGYMPYKMAARAAPSGRLVGRYYRTAHRLGEQQRY